MSVLTCVRICRGELGGSTALALQLAQWVGILGVQQKE